MKVTFPTDLSSIESRVKSIDPIQYGSSRNYIDGAVSLLSPYISRGFISTKQVFQSVVSLGFKPYQITKFVQELTWRDYFQQVWRNKREGIFYDLKQPQPGFKHKQIPIAILEKSIHTGIPGIDHELIDFYETSYLHNHVRMYIASIVCNIGGAYWEKPSQWMYYHLLDADAASNNCSWQWISGAFSSRKYFANQENINRYLKTNDFNTYLDFSYDELQKRDIIPKELESLMDWDLTNAFQSTKEWFKSKQREYQKNGIFDTFCDTENPLRLDQPLPICLYDFYNLDPNWKQDIKIHRVFMMRPHFFKQFPSSHKTLDFIHSLALNIPNIKFFWGEWDDLLEQVQSFRPTIYWKEHPTNKEYVGKEEPRDWIFPDVQGYYPSFFAYWKKCEKKLNRIGEFQNPNLFDQ